MGEGLADNTIKKAVTKLAKGISTSPRLIKALTYIANISGEAAEEMIADILSPIAKRLTYDENADWNSIEEILYSGLLGAGISGLMGGGVLFQGNEQSPTQTYDKQAYDEQIIDIQTGIDEDLKTLYDGIENDDITNDNLGENIEATKQILELTKQAYPELSDFLDSHIDKLNDYKTQATEKPQTNENIEVEQLVNGDAKIAQNANNDVMNDIKENQIQPIKNVVETPTVEEKSVIEEQKIEEKPIEEISPIAKEEIPTETIKGKVVEKQDGDIREQEFPIGGTILNKNGAEYKIKSWDKDIATVINTTTNEESTRTMGLL